MDWTCQACGSKEPEPRYPVLKDLPDGQRKKIYVCEDCLPHFERVENMIQRFDGTLRSVEERGHSWANGTTLHYSHNHIIYYMLESQLSDLDPMQREKYIQEHAFEPTRLPLETFPLIEDFEICLEGLIARHELHTSPIPYFMASFYSPSLGYLAHFSGKDTTLEFCKPDFVIPHGDFTLPYYDFEQGVDLLITEDHQFVYVLFGNWERYNDHHDEPGVWRKIENYYDAWFKVKKERYYSQWENAIQLSRAYHSALGKQKASQS